MAQQIIASKTVSGNTPKTRRIIEKSGQTFVIGAPVQVDSGDGGVKEWTGNPAADNIAGIACEDANNIAVTGSGAPGPMMPYTGVGSGLSFGSVPYQTGAKNIPRGQPFTDGRVGLFVANSDTVFSGQVGAAQTTVATDVTAQYGMTKDADGRWYVDRTKNGANAVVAIVALDPLDGPKLGGRVLFTFLAAKTQLLA